MYSNPFSLRLQHARTRSAAAFTLVALVLLPLLPQAQSAEAQTACGPKPEDLTKGLAILSGKSPDGDWCGGRSEEPGGGNVPRDKATKAPKATLNCDATKDRLRGLCRAYWDPTKDKDGVRDEIRKIADAWANSQCSPDHQPIGCGEVPWADCDGLKQKLRSACCSYNETDPDDTRTKEQYRTQILEIGRAQWGTSQCGPGNSLGCGDVGGCSCSKDIDAPPRPRTGQTAGGQCR